MARGRSRSVLGVHNGARETMSHPHTAQETTSTIKRGCAKYLIRSGRGAGLVARITDLPRDFLDGTLYILAINGVFGANIDPANSARIVFGFVITKKVFEYFSGWGDEIFGFWKYENDYASRKINPFNHELMERIKNIEHSVCNDDPPTPHTDP